MRLMKWDGNRGERKKEEGAGKETYKNSAKYSAMKTSLLALLCVVAAAYALPLAAAAAVQAKRDGSTVDDINIAWCFHPNVCARAAKQGAYVLIRRRDSCLWDGLLMRCRQSDVDGVVG
ncbi:hypothetical protein AB1N83_012002 [Pleurotus pulmonarius]